MSTFNAIGAVRGRAAAASCRLPICEPPCAPCVGPCLPEQGGLMPVLWQPAVHTSRIPSPPEYTLNVVSSQWLSKGVLLRFLMWPGCDDSTQDPPAAAEGDLGSAMTFQYAEDNDFVSEFDLTLQQDVPPNTVLVVAMNTVGTALWAYDGATVYADGGRALPASAFVNNASLLCLAFVPTPGGAWTPTRGRPMFAIGFNHPEPPQMGRGAGDVPCGTATTYAAQRSAPNFPDQFSTYPDAWTVTYRVVYPYIAVAEDGLVPPSLVCRAVLGIKYRHDVLFPTYAVGSWSTLRDAIAQPWSIVKNNYTSVSDWYPYDVYTDPTPTSDVGPFVLAAEAGQLAVVYWRPRYKDINTDAAPIVVPPGTPYGDSGSAQVGMLVTSPLQPNQVLYFTTEQYDADDGVFGPRDASGAPFLLNAPSFQWTVGSSVIPAGTVVFIANIGGDAGPISIVDAHDSTADVGAITNNLIAGQAVTSLIVMSAWQTYDSDTARVRTPAAYFVTAALSDQYAGDIPPLSPMVTMARTRWSGTVAYQLGARVDASCLPGGVQAVMVNSAILTQLPFGTAVDPTSLPTFCGMAPYHW